ncbi:putative DOF domain class transcription factor [Hibiscus syriacus]|uniref:DOF domain class transcription factor n=1 Tax=Hibiscus syriacus TaxID=106335 RepID=A0A6A2YSV8_HIBSY|nr:putative DOF domain class transcription factor [Hibiscus syriacus]
MFNRSGSSEVPQRVSPRAVRQLKPTKAFERYSPRRLVSEKKLPGRISELELQNSQLQEELKKVKDQLNSSESCNKEALQDAEEFRKQMLAMSAKVEICRKPLLEPASERPLIVELDTVSQGGDRAWLSELEAIRKQQSVYIDVNEIQQLKDHLEMVAESETKQTKQADSAHLDLENLKGNLVDTLSLVSNMKNRLKDGRESEAPAEVLASETLLQLEAARKTVEALRSEGVKAVEAYNSIASDLHQSKERVYSLQGPLNKLKADLTDAGGNNSLDSDGDHIVVEHQTREDEKHEESHQLEAEISSLRSALETSEIKRHEEQIQSIIQIKSANEQMDRIKSEANSREAELLAKLQKANLYITTLKANLMAKETELQGISDQNEELHMKLEKSPSCQLEPEQNELKALKEAVDDLKANMMDKETELQYMEEENEMLRSEIRKRDMNISKTNDKVAVELELARAAKLEATTKLELAMEEADKNSRRATRVTEQLEAMQADNSAMAVELRRLKVQSEQWRKAAELAAAMLTASNNGKKFIERTGSLDSNHYSKIGSPFTEDMDDDFLKKKNANMLKKIGVLWKKQQK